jgi:ADP-ribosylglycohydrolase
VNEIWPPDSATCLNPHREWIGAQIRADGWAYACPGWPEQAAALAWRDAAVSHVKNGIYGEMFFAALIAACLGTDDLHAALAAARREIPDRSRLAEAIDDTVAWCAEDKGWEQTWERMNEKYGHYHPVHTINNAVICLLAALHAPDDFERAVSISVMSGLDTDCNGATVGSFMGALLGPEAIPAKLTEPLHDTLHTSLSGLNVVSISDMATRSLATAKAMGALD